MFGFWSDEARKNKAWKNIQGHSFRVSGNLWLITFSVATSLADRCLGRLAIRLRLRLRIGIEAVASRTGNHDKGVS